MSRSYSPSAVHWRLAEQVSPALSYDGGDVWAWQNRLRPKLAELLGMHRMPADGQKCPLNKRTLWKRENELGTIEKIVFTAEPDADVPCYLCRPASVQPPYPIFICLQGHTTGMHNSVALAFEDESQPIEVTGDRDFAIECMKRGLGALCIEQRGFGERAERQQEKLGPKGCYDAALHAFMLGRTLIGERVYDVHRAIELIEHEGDFDMSRLGIMGNSAGGTTAVYAAALRPDKLRLAMPSCCFGTYRDGGHMHIARCLCSYIPDVLNWAEMADVLGLFAPNPLVVVSAKDDNIIPWPGAQEGFRQLQRIYKAAEAENHCRLVVGEQGHRFYAQPAWQTMMPMLDLIPPVPPLQPATPPPAGG